MKINVLHNQQDPFSQTILYAPELKLPETNHVAEKCFPAVRFSELYPQEYFFILESEIGQYEEYSRYSKKPSIYSYFGGKEGLEQKFQEMYNEQMKNLEMIVKMEDAKLIKLYNIGGKITELRFTPKANTQTWPWYDDSLPLRYMGYWYGTHDHHEHIGKTEKEAMEYLAGNYGI